MTPLSDKALMTENNLKAGSKTKNFDFLEEREFIKNELNNDRSNLLDPSKKRLLSIMQKILPIATDNFQKMIYKKTKEEYLNYK